MHIPDFMPMLDDGAHTNPSQGACVMEYISVLAGEKWSDLPSCTKPHVARMAQWVNDYLPEGERNDFLLPLVPILMRTGALEDTPETWTLSRAARDLMRYRGDHVINDKTVTSRMQNLLVEILDEYAKQITDEDSVTVEQVEDAVRFLVTASSK